MSLSVNKISKSPSLSFKANPVKKFNYVELKNLPNLNCACCGEKLINPIEFKNAFRTITLPLKRMMDQGFLKSWEETDSIWSVLTSFCKKFPDKSLDQMKSIDEGIHLTLFMGIKNELLKDAHQEGITLDEKQLDDKTKGLYRDILNRSRSTLKGSGPVMRRLASFKKCLSGHKLEAFEQLEIYSKKYPRKKISEILAMDEIFEFHSMKDRLQRAEMHEKSDYHFNNIETLIRKNKPEEVEYFQEVKNEALSLLDTEPDKFARIPKMKGIYAKALEEKGCEKLKLKVFKELEQVPVNYITKDSFLAYAHRHNLTDFQIISSIMTPSVASFEHIVPSSQGGENSIDNGLIFCRNCNSKRASRHYLEFMQYHPRLPYNIQKQILKISRYILNGTLQDDLKFYPINVAKTLSVYTDGQIEPDISFYCKNGIEVFDQKVKEGFLKVCDLQGENIELDVEKLKLTERLNEIEREKSINVSEIKNLKRATTKDMSLKHQLEEYLDKSKKS